MKKLRAIKKVYHGVKGERIVVENDTSSDEKELKRQWSMVEKQNRKLPLLYCMVYDRVIRRDALHAILFIIIGLAVLFLFVL